MTAQTPLPPTVRADQWLWAARFFKTRSLAKQAIGKRYARMDEIGTPYCITVDGDTVSGGQVTVRDRDTAQQERVEASRLGAYFASKFGA